MVVRGPLLDGVAVELGCIGKSRELLLSILNLIVISLIFIHCFVIAEKDFSVVSFKVCCYTGST